MSEEHRNDITRGRVWKGILGLGLLVALIVLTITAIVGFFAFGFTMGLPIDAGNP